MQNHVSLYNKGERLYGSDQHALALRYFRRSLALRYSNDTYNYIGCCYLQMNKYDEAASIFKRLIANCPSWERPVMNLGRVYLKKGDCHAALFLLIRAQHMNPNNDDVYFYKGVLFEKTGNFHKAIEQYEESLRLNDHQGESHFNLSFCYFQIHKFAEAAEECKLSIQFDYRVGSALYRLGDISRRLKQYHQALGYFIESQAISGDSVALLCQLSEVCFLLGETDRALGYYHRLALLPEERIGSL